jgi:hypothetical protein
MLVIHGDTTGVMQFQARKRLGNTNLHVSTTTRPLKSNSAPAGYVRKYDARMTPYSKKQI